MRSTPVSANSARGCTMPMPEDYQEGSRSPGHCDRVIAGGSLMAARGLLPEARRAGAIAEAPV